MFLSLIMRLASEPTLRPGSPEISDGNIDRWVTFTR